MSTAIKLTIASDGERCGECQFFDGVFDSACGCKLFDIELEPVDEQLSHWYRCQPGLDAEVKDK